MRINFGNISDIDTVINIEKQSIKDPWSSNNYREHIINNGIILIAQTEENYTAFLSGKIILDEAEIYRVAVLKTFRQRNIATSLINKFEKLAKERSVSSIFLEVRKSNINAISLYCKCGFKNSGVRKKYYKDGEDCIIMSKSL